MLVSRHDPRPPRNAEPCLVQQSMQTRGQNKTKKKRTDFQVRSPQYLPPAEADGALVVHVRVAAALGRPYFWCHMRADGHGQDNVEQTQPCSPDHPRSRVPDPRVRLHERVLVDVGKEVAGIGEELREEPRGGRLGWHGVQVDARLLLAASARLLLCSAGSAGIGLQRPRDVQKVSVARLASSSRVVGGLEGYAARQCRGGLGDVPEEGDVRGGACPDMTMVSIRKTARERLDTKRTTHRRSRTLARRQK